MWLLHAEHDLYCEKKRKYWVHQLWRATDEEGEFHTIHSRLKSDQDKFFMYFRMSVWKYENLFKILGHQLTNRILNGSKLFHWKKD
jgi:hypothetical protein